MARPLSADSESDVIVAPATAPGVGAVAIVRLSGGGAHELAVKLFRPGSGTARLSPADPGRMVLGEIVSTKGELIDKAFAVLFRGPRSYTGEDVAEFHVHGATAVVQSVLDAAIMEGARLARPGEFTRRAFLNGRLDLAQAEAVCDLIQSQTGASARAALGQLGGGLSHRLETIREGLIPVLAELEATIDFPEEGIEGATRERLGERVDGALGDINALLDSVQRGRALREGFRLVLAGAPNAGKSSLFNMLVGRERAIVSPHPGTTRDTVEAQVELEGVAVTLVDTAGLRALPEEIEAMGIARTNEEIRSAGLVLFLVDSTRPEESVAEYAKMQDVPHLVVANKIDRAGSDAGAVWERYRLGSREGVVALSTKTGEGFVELEKLLKDRLRVGTGTGDSLMVTRERHALALLEARRGLSTVAEGLASSLSPEFIALDLADSIARLDSITGRGGLDEDVLDSIFLQFCLGK